MQVWRKRLTFFFLFFGDIDLRFGGDGFDSIQVLSSVRLVLIFFGHFGVGFDLIILLAPPPPPIKFGCIEWRRVFFSFFFLLICKF